MRRFIRIIPLVLVIAGFVLAGRSVLYYSRGIVTKGLIVKSWQETQKSKEDTSPWSWADFYPVSKMKIPELDLDCFVMDKISDEAMAYGAGHLSQTPLPGEKGNVVIAGHRDGEFRKLEGIQMGMTINLETKNNTFCYSVTGVDTAFGSDVHWIDKTENNCITLITCYPFEYIGNAEKRFVVRGELK